MQQSFSMSVSGLDGARDVSQGMLQRWCFYACPSHRPRWHFASVRSLVSSSGCPRQCALCYSSLRCRTGGDRRQGPVVVLHASSKLKPRMRLKKIKNQDPLSLPSEAHLDLEAHLRKQLNFGIQVSIGRLFHHLLDDIWPSEANMAANGSCTSSSSGSTCRCVSRRHNDVVGA